MAKAKKKTTTKKKNKTQSKVAKKEKTSTKPATKAIPTAGKKAPAFSLKNANEDVVKLSQFVERKHVVLYFYPKDMTPGCTVEAQDFQNSLAKFKRKNIEVIGVSPDNTTRHQKFIEKYNLRFELLCDEDHKVAEKYGVWTEKSLYGRKFMGIQRSTFLIAKSGQIVAAWPKVRVKGHVDDVLQTANDEGLR